MSVAENALLVVTALVVTIGLVGMLTVMLAGLNERRREMAILRSVGARPRHILLLVTGESLLLSLVGIAIGLLLLYGGLLVAQPYVESHFGLYLPITLPAPREWFMLGLVGTSGLLIGLIPGYRAYRYSRRRHEHSNLEEPHESLLLLFCCCYLPFSYSTAYTPNRPRNWIGMR